MPSNLTRILRNPRTAKEPALHGKAAGLEMRAGDTTRVETLGGGGFGPPAERPVALLAADLREGKVSLAAARRDYPSELLNAALVMARLGAGR
jgi:N-methylhydantoinase B